MRPWIFARVLQASQAHVSKIISKFVSSQRQLVNRNRECRVSRLNAFRTHRYGSSSMLVNPYNGASFSMVDMGGLSPSIFGTQSAFYRRFQTINDQFIAMNMNPSTIVNICRHSFGEATLEFFIASSFWVNTAWPSTWPIVSRNIRATSVAGR